MIEFSYDTTTIQVHKDKELIVVATQNRVNSHFLINLLNRLKDHEDLNFMEVAEFNIMVRMLPSVQEIKTVENEESENTTEQS